MRVTIRSAAQLLSLHGAVAARIAAEGASAASAATASTKAASAGASVKGLVVAGAIATGAAGLCRAAEHPGACRAADRRNPSGGAATCRQRAGGVGSARTRAESRDVAPRPRANPAGLRTLACACKTKPRCWPRCKGRCAMARPPSALGKLESYDRRFPGGMLRSEADAARVFALCGVGKSERARAAAVRFVQRYPNAPATARVQSACK